MDDVDAGFFDAADVKGVRVNELDDEHAENVLVAEVGGRGDLRQAAKEFTQRVRARLRRVVCCEKFEKAVADSLLFLIDDRVASGVDEYVRRDESRERNYLPFDFQ